MDEKESSLYHLRKGGDPVDVALLIFEKRSRILLFRREDTWLLPGGMVAPGETPETALEKSAKEIVGAGIKKIFKKMKGVFPGISPKTSCEIRACVFVGELDIEGSKLPKYENGKIGWFGRKYIFQLNLSDVARKALENYFK